MQVRNIHIGQTIINVVFQILVAMQANPNVCATNRQPQHKRKNACPDTQTPDHS